MQLNPMCALRSQASGSELGQNASGAPAPSQAWLESQSTVTPLSTVTLHPRNSEMQSWMWVFQARKVHPI